MSRINDRPKFEDAVFSLVPEAQLKIEGGVYEGLSWFDKRTKPTQSEIDTELKKLQDEYDAQAYARNRQADYPDWGTQLNKIYDDGVTKWKSEMVDPVKAKWPKDNSGPVE